MDVAVGLVFFNPANSKRILMNYYYTLNHLQNLPVYTLELAFEDRNHEIPTSKNVFRVRSNSFMFHKERMCRVLETKIPKKYKKIVFMDADIFFSTPEWYCQMSKKLDDFDVVHGFETAHWLDLTYKNIINSRPTIVLNKSGKYDHYYHPGFVWGFQRKWYNAVGFFDYGISGSGDVSAGCKFMRYPDAMQVAACPKSFVPAYNEYYSLETPTLSYLEKVRVFHLYHGSKANRQYVHRHSIFKVDIDIRSLLYLNNDQVYEWHDSPTWNQKMMNFFSGRDDDGVDITNKDLIVDNYIENVGFHDLNIKSATWGSDSNVIDAKRILTSRIDIENIFVSWNLFPSDPAYGKKKCLKIEYEDGRIQVIQEYETFSVLTPIKNIWNFLEKVVYINLARRTDRLARMDYITKSFGDKVIRFEAIENIRGEIGATMSHISVLKMALKNKWKNVLILEDDLEWNKFESGYAMLEKFASEPYDVIMLGSSQLKHDNHRVISAKTAASYLVNAHYIPKLLSNFEEGLQKLIKSKIPYLEDKENPLDQYWQPLQTSDNWRVVVPSLLYQETDYSDIEKKVIDHKPWSSL